MKVSEDLVVNILTSVVACLLLNISRELPKHAKKARLISNIETALRDFALDSGVQLTESQLSVGVILYNNLLKDLDEVLTHECS